MILLLKIMCFLTFFSFLFSYYILLYGNSLGKFFAKNKIMIFRVLNFISSVTSIIGFILFVQVNQGGIDIFIVPGIFTILPTILFFFRKKKQVVFQFHLKKGEYTIEGFASTDYFCTYKYENVIKTNDKIILINGAPPSLDEDLDIECQLVKENLYVGSYYISNLSTKMKVKNIMDVLLNLYAISVFCAILSILDFHMSRPQMNVNIALVVMPILFFISNACVKISKYSRKVMDKIFHIIAFLFYILSLIGIVIMWF